TGRRGCDNLHYLLVAYFPVDFSVPVLDRRSNEPTLSTDFFDRCVEQFELSAHDAVPPELRSTARWWNSSIWSWHQTTARPAGSSLTGCGNFPAFILAYRELLLHPVAANTSGFRMICLI